MFSTQRRQILPGFQIPYSKGVAGGNGEPSTIRTDSPSATNILAVYYGAPWECPILAARPRFPNGDKRSRATDEPSSISAETARVSSETNYFSSCPVVP